MKSILIACIPFLMYTASCKDTTEEEEIIEIVTDTPTNGNATAQIVSVTTSGDENSYSFNVGIRSNETGCNQYADWWEVLSEDGTLLYRRILAHSHVNEQPFVRSGGPVAIAKDQVVIVRAHMNNTGYGEEVFKGSVDQGFEKTTLEKGFASELQSASPLPSGCAF